jgi:hypothetical protein
MMKIIFHHLHMNFAHPGSGVSTIIISKDSSQLRDSQQLLKQVKLNYDTINFYTAPELH